MLFVLAAFILHACTTSKPVAESTPSQVSDAGTATDITEARILFVRGLTAMEQKRWQEAEQLLVQAHSMQPEMAGIAYSLADFYLQTDDQSSALHYAERAVQLDPDNHWYRQQLIEVYLEAGNYSRVMQEIELSLARRPSDLSLLFLKARIHSELGQYRESNQVYERILSLTGQERSVRLQRIANFNRLNDLEAIVEELESMISHDPQNVQNRLMLSQYLTEMEQHERAKEALELAREIAPSNPEVLVNLADSYIRQEQWQAAGDLLEELVSDTGVPVSNRLEIVQFVLGRFSSEIENEPLRNTAGTLVEMLVEQEPDNGLTQAMAAEFYMATEQNERALEYLQRTTELLPENDAAWRQLLQTLYLEGRYEEAAATGKQADEFVPEDVFIHFFTGGSHFLLDEHDQAVVWLQSAANLPAPMSFKSIILGTLADVYAASEQWELADEHYDKALEANPENDVVLNNYAYYLAEREMRLEEARDMAIRALEMSPDNAAFLDTMGWIYFRLGDYHKAYDYIRASLDTGEASAEVMEHMGDVYDKLGEPENARYWWQKALEEDDTRTYLNERLQATEES